MSNLIVRDQDAAVLLLSLMYTPGVGPVRLASAWQSIERLGLTATQILDEGDLLRGVLTDEQVGARSQATGRARETVDKLAAQGVSLFVLGDATYPRRLRNALGAKAPRLLSCLGNPALLDAPAVGFCGSRKASERGLAVAVDCSEQLARHGVTVVSGYATGVDLACHTTTLQHGGATVFVLAEGISHFRVKQGIRGVWDWDRVAVVSEFLPNLPWTVGNAMQRNRTICGLSDAMVLIEAGETGGSIAAGRECLAMKRPLFAPVYDGMPEWAIGNRLMLAEGAYPLLRSRTSGRANMTKVLDLVLTGCQQAAADQIEDAPRPVASKAEPPANEPSPSPSPPPVSAVLFDIEAGQPPRGTERAKARSPRRRTGQAG